MFGRPLLIQRPLLRGAGLLLSLTLPAATQAAVEDHVVPLVELNRRAASASEQRRANLDKASSFLSIGRVEQALRAGKLEPAQVRQAVALLSDDELARFAAQSDRVRANLEAGALSNLELTYVVIALATAVVILVIVVAD